MYCTISVKGLTTVSFHFLRNCSLVNPPELYYNESIINFGGTVMAKKKTLWETYTPEQLTEAQAFCEDYKAFMSSCKTERECVTGIIETGGFNVEL